MNNDNKESDFDRGVRLGYVLSYKNLTALKILQGFAHESSQMYKGLIAGQKEFEHHKKIITVDQWKLQERQAKLKKISEKEKDREQNEHER